MTYIPPAGYDVLGPNNPLSQVRTVYDDEFEGAAIDTAGTRFSGATAWAAQNLGTSTIALRNSSLVVAGQIAAGDHLRGYEQALPGGGATWKRRVRAFLQPVGSSEWGAHIWVRNNANGKCESFGVSKGSSSTLRVYTWTDVNTFAATILSTLTIADYELGLGSYLEVEYDGTSCIYRYSRQGVIYQTYSTRATATFLGAAPTHIGIGQECSNNTSNPGGAVFDYFRSL